MNYGRPGGYLTDENPYARNETALGTQQGGSQAGGLADGLSNGLQAYRMYQMFGGSGSGGGGFLSGLLGGGGGMNASGGASGLAFQGGAPASSGGSGGFLSGLFGGGGSGSGGAMAGMGAAALPLGLFGAGMYLALSEASKHDKQLAKHRKKLGPEEVARRNAKERKMAAEGYDFSGPTDDGE